MNRDALESTQHPAGSNSQEFAIHSLALRLRAVRPDGAVGGGLVDLSC